MSWQSTLTYYRLLNEAVGERLGGHHSADLRIWSGDFEPIHQAQLKDDHDWIGSVLADAGRALAEAGAELLVIASNTCHRYASQVESAAGIPVLHIIDATARKIGESGMTSVLLLGTDYTMSGDYYTGYVERFGMSVCCRDLKRGPTCTGLFSTSWSTGISGKIRKVSCWASSKGLQAGAPRV